jgi:hypothetical protein
MIIISMYDIIPAVAATAGVVLAFIWDRMRRHK